MKKIIILIVSTLIFLYVPAVAGQKEDLAKELLNLTDMQKMLDQIVVQIQQMQDSQLKLLDIPKKDQEKFKQFKNKLMKKIFDTMNWEKMETEYIKLYSSTYTIEELKAILEFYKSPAGQSMLKKQPLLMQKVMELAQTQTQNLLPEIKKMTGEFVASIKDEK